MNESNEKMNLDANQIERLNYILAQKANIWYISGGRESEGIEVFRTQDEEIFVIKDIETGYELGMRKEVTSGGVVTKLSFFSFKKQE